MNWLSFLFSALVILQLLLPTATFAESEGGVVIQAISHAGASGTQETITFKLASPVVPKIFVLRGEKPRLVIDFPGAVYLGKNTIALEDGVLASAVRTGLHQTPVLKTRAVVDLSKEQQVQYTSKYLTEENTLVVTLTGESEKQQQQKQQPQPQPAVSTVKESQAERKLEESKKAPAKLTDTTAAPSPVVTEKKVAQEPATRPARKPETKPEVKPEVMPEVKTVAKTVAKPVVKPLAKPLLERNTADAEPTILEISFDDSSNRGEMALFHLNDFYPPKVSAIEKGRPRVLCDFMSMNLGPNVQQTILAQGKYIERIRTAKHTDPDKIRVVLDLAPDRDYDLQQVYFRNDNLFVLIVNELNQQDKQ